MVVGVPPSDTARSSGNRYSTTVPPWASAAASLDGRRSSGNWRYMARLSAGTGSSGELLTMIVTTLGKWWLSLEVAAPHQMASCTTIAPARSTFTSSPATANTISVVQ